MRATMRGVVLGLLLIAGTASAQTPMRAIVRPSIAAQAPAAQSGAARVSDPMTNLELRLKALTAKVNALQSQVADLQAARAGTVSFQCTDDQTSRASNGVTEACSPYACDGQIGRCRKIAATSADCSSGFSWCATTNQCTTADQCH